MFFVSLFALEITVKMDHVFELGIILETVFELGLSI